MEQAIIIARICRTGGEIQQGCRKPVRVLSARPKFFTSFYFEMLFHFLASSFPDGISNRKCGCAYGYLEFLLKVFNFL
ncbi:MAG: hypothetical protein LBF49_00435 [Puniceicoccales bacterium]|jgi:hypothetical protein|nr:hypothetical protein [Puniceicoccales bacterium]